MKVAAYQAPLIAEGAMESIDRMQQCVRECETNGVSVLCFPEAILGGLADFSDDPGRLVIRTDYGQLATVLEPLASDTVTSIIGFSELGRDGRCTMRLPYINAAESRACTARFIQPYGDRYIATVRKHLYFARAS